MHEVVVEEHCILDSVNYELATCTLADWVPLFETRFSLSVASSAALPTGDWLTALTAGARPFRGSRTLGLVSCQSLCPRPPTLPGIHAKSHRKLCLVPLVLGLDQLLAVRSSLKVEPRWLGPPPLARVLLLFLRLSYQASFQDV